MHKWLLCCEQELVAKEGGVKSVLCRQAERIKESIDIYKKETAMFMTN